MQKLILPLVVLSALAPTSAAKTLCIASIALVLLYGLRLRTLSKHLKWKLAISLLFLPGFLNALLVSPENLVRFAPVFLLSWLYPYDPISVDIKLLRAACFASVCWLVVGQIFLALGNPGMVAIRDNYYPIDFNGWNYGITETIVQGFGEFRAGGVYYNPNVLAGNIFLAYLPLYILRNYSEMQEKWSAHFPSLFHISTFMAGLGIFLTATRSYIVPFALLFLLPNLYSLIRLIISLRFSFRHFSLVFACIILFSLVSERLLQGFDADSSGSAAIKNQILSSYIDSVDVNHLIFGGFYNLQFDAEYGYWLGSAGVLGLLAVLLFYFMIVANSSASAPIILLFLLIGIGNTLLYGLLTATLIIPVIILLARESFIAQPGIIHIGEK